MIMSEAIALQQYQYVAQCDYDDDYEDGGDDGDDDGDTQRHDWERFAKANEGRVQETIDLERDDATFRARGYKPFPDYDTEAWSTDIRYGGKGSNSATSNNNTTGPYTPSWQN